MFPMETAPFMFPIIETASTVFDWCTCFVKEAVASVARIPATETETINSMRVMPRSLV
jgi:hypothetical protein